MCDMYYTILYYSMGCCSVIQLLWGGGDGNGKMYFWVMGIYHMCYYLGGRGYGREEIYMEYS